MQLTESLAMLPAASVSGFYLAHPASMYFNVGKIAEDQVADWARRNALDRAQAAARAGAAVVGSPPFMGKGVSVR
jgi:5-methyltetrahydrofolate--homocysteine methyltransferase